MRIVICLLVGIFILSAETIDAQSSREKILFRNVKVFDGISPKLSGPVNVFIQDGIIQRIGPEPVAVTQDMTVIDGKGKVLMPGLIDVHVHLVFGALTMQEMMSPDFSDSLAFMKAGQSAEQMLMNGFTSVRDAGGPIFPIKAAIDLGKINGPRIWPSGAVISQAGGHGDFRTPAEKSRLFFGQPARAEIYGATFIANGRDEVLTAVREDLRMGASQIKVMAGGGTTSAYDPVDVTQYTFDEMRAAVQAADDWGTYVMVHAYTPKAVRRAIDAGVKCIEHGQLLDASTMQLMAQKKIWLSTQNLEENSPDMDPLRIEKRKAVLEGQDKIWPMAKRYKVRLAWGTDFLFNPPLNAQRNRYILRLQKWFSNFEILKMITHDNAELLQLSGLRSPYPGKLGVVKKGALADLILVNGNPLADLNLIADPEKNFLVIIKAGRTFKNY